MGYAYLKFGVVIGIVMLNVQPVLPIKSVDCNLGNELAGRKGIPMVELSETCADCQSNDVADNIQETFWLNCDLLPSKMC